jgi:hypothetical protein
LCLLRLLWFALFLASLTFSIYLVVGTIRTYTAYGVTTKTRTSAESESMKFPMITFCNSKPFMSKSANDFAVKQFLAIYGPHLPPNPVASVLYGNFTDPDDLKTFTFSNEINLVQLAILNQIADPSFNKTLQKSFGLQLDQFFNVYQFQSTSFPLEHFIWFWDPNYGNCFQFNSGLAQNGSSLKILQQTEAGFSNGLFVVNLIDVFPKQSFNFLNLYQIYTFGIKISIDDQPAIPLTHNNMIPIKPGACTYINLKKTVTAHLAKPYSSCTDTTNFHSILYDKIINLNKTYTQRVCFQLCKQMQVISTCGCAMNFYPNVDNYSTCGTLDKVNCYYNFTFDLDSCGDLCPLECQTVSFDFTTASEIYPDHSNYVIQKADPETLALFENANVSLANASFSDVAYSLACVYIYYQDLQTTFINETQAMNFVSLKKTIINLFKA